MSAVVLTAAASILLQNEENPMTHPKTPKPQSTKSKTVLISLVLYAFALAGGVVAIATPVVAPLAIIIALVATGLCILSLREIL